MSRNVEQPAATPDQKRQAWRTAVIAVLTVAAAIGVGRLVVPLGINAVFPNRTTAPLPPRPEYGTVHQLQDPDPVVRQKTVESLAELNPGNLIVARQISALMLTDSETVVRRTAAESLAATQPMQQVLPDLIQALADPDPQVRRAVIRAVVVFDSLASRAVPALNAIAEDETASSDLRAAATDAIARIQETPKPATKNP